ncbi:hypothetical protein [Halorubrum ezzemoulense]|uniref:capsular polysaccharide export protein, LipB/KpsS family n=1 Tax=Halorubrum ezzemoulense TaxID=337243 RepID=UPI00232ACB1F|nr:hypothetical protein [Halorubrum ezzemoulense]MDB9235923.1 hypothetical protein [Halorubrum ezzemoulense]
MTSTVVFAPVGTALRTSWVLVAKTLRNRGDEVYFFDPNPILCRLLRQEGLGESIIQFNDGRSAKLPLSSKRDAFILDFNVKNFRKSYETIQSEYANFHYNLERLDVDVCLFWNDYRSIGVVAAENKNIDCLFLENGYDPGTIQIDTAGVNRNSSISGFSTSEVCSLQRPYELPKKLEVANVSSLKKNSLVTGFISKVFNDPGAARLSIEHRLPNIKELLPQQNEQPTLPSSYVFVPFQVHDDTQIQYNSPIIDDMSSFLTVVRQAVGAVSPDQTVVVKEHPSDRHRINYADLQTQFSDVCWFTNYDIEELIASAQAVVTINSSVGFQALAKGVPVVTVGDALYDSAPNVWSANNLSEVREELESALETDVDEQKVNSYVESVRDNLFIPGTPTKFSNKTVRHIIGYIDYLISTEQDKRFI